MASSVTSSVQRATLPSTDPVDEINVPAGEPATERYPGALDASQYGPGQTTTPGSPAGPVGGSWSPQQFGTDVPEQAPGGGYQDTAWATGHDGPSVPWDSSAGEPFAGSGAVNPALHEGGTGATFVKEYVVPAGIGSLTRHTMVGGTTNRLAPTQDAIGQTEPNGRQDLDQQQWHNPDGYDPWEIPYAERPIMNNLAYEAVAISPEGSVYTPSGELPDRAPYDYSAQAYEAPPDPYVGTQAQAQAQSYDSGIGGGWV